MNRSIIILYSLAITALLITEFPNGGIAVIMVLLLSLAVIGLIKKYEPDDRKFLINVFLLALTIRIFFGLFISYSSLQSFFGGDTLTYDTLGATLVDLWSGTGDPTTELSKRALSTTIPGWGMSYLTGAIYYTLGRSVIIAQSFCAVMGAATASMIFFCAQKIFNNQRVAKNSALAIAFFPSFIIWSSQLMKDGLIVFLLACTMTMVLQLQKKFNLYAVAILILSMFGIITLRFYIFYMLAVAVAGSFVIGLGATSQSVVRRVIVIVLMGISLTYLGVLNNTSNEIDRYASLEAVQRSRSDLARTAKSGFGEDVDVSTTEGAISAIPIGFLYLMLAPFPWQMTNIRQLITLPEVLIWWACIPLIFSGLWYSIKNRLREAIPILLFTLMLTLAYSIFQGNVGTAYRQRTQIQVFLFIFVAVGWTLKKERQENAIVTKRRPGI